MQTYKEKHYGPERTNHHTFFLPYKTILNMHLNYFVMNGCISLKFFIRQEYSTVHIKKQQKKIINETFFF